MPFAVHRCQRASGGFCSLSYMDASFLYTFMFLSLFGFCFMSKLHSLRSLAPLEHNPAPPSTMHCNINHFDITCMFTLIWFTCRLYDSGSGKYGVDPFDRREAEETWEATDVCAKEYVSAGVRACMSVCLHVSVVVRWIELFVVNACV